MSLLRAITAFVVLVAVVVGGSASARAHAGHVHASTPSLQKIGALNAENGSRILAAADIQTFKAPVGPSFSKFSVSETVATMDAGVTGNESHRSTDCLPGACCCQGLSSCGMAGHCCAGALPHAHAWWDGEPKDARIRMADQGWIYLHIIFGLDRPPKA